jgi:lipopolysaccharide transport protein LptA
MKNDKSQLCYTSSDNVMYYTHERYAIYSGDVHVKQGTTQLTGDKMTLFLDKSRHRITQLIVVGHPARYLTKSDNNKDDVIAEAGIIKYYPAEAQALLLEDGRITQGHQTLRSAEIHYDVKMETAISSKSSPGQTTSVIIEPQA